jgi:lipoyl-dependent peroxiredoxin subunit D
MNLETLRDQIPDYAKDLRLNLETVLTEAGAPGLTAQQVATVAVASAIASRFSPLTRAVTDWARASLAEKELDAARSAAAIMGMTNVYYRFTHLVHEPEYKSLRAGLRMNVLGQHGTDKLAFELASLAVSAINGCGRCMDSHEKTVRQHGASAQAVQSAVRIASVVHAVAVVLEQRPVAAAVPA